MVFMQYLSLFLVFYLKLLYDCNLKNNNPAKFIFDPFTIYQDMVQSQCGCLLLKDNVFSFVYASSYL